ncbi:MAG: NAD-binding protein [Uliginosibacterium sp.]|nr:NAD-binding protein [Uliginosibacterium sp.]
MGDILFLVLRRMRAPLIALILAYAISVLGLVLVPGQDGAGAPARMGFFHAFYVVSYTATTIGFGELPFVFTDAQRAWVTFTIYLSVTCWAYTVGSIFALVQDQTFRGAVARSRFAGRVRLLDEPFYILVGYGQSGTSLAHAFDDLGVRSVILELRPERAARPDIEIFREQPLALAADARWPDVLRDAGVTHPRCKALVVMVSEDEVAQAVAIGASALNPRLPVIARVHSALARDNLEGFGNITVIDPFETFGTNLRLSISAPAVLWVEEWLSSVPGSSCPRPASIPRGHWLILGYGRFGHAVAQALEETGSTWEAIDTDLKLPDHPHLRHCNNSVQSLNQAGIEQAVGVVACTDRDATNLALISRARKLKPGLCVIIRQNHVADRSLIEAAQADMCFVKADVMVRECLQLLVAPLLNRFLMEIRARGPALAEAVAVRLLTELEERVPHIWSFACLAAYPGLREVLADGCPSPLRLGELLINPTDPSQRLAAVALVLLRGNDTHFLPDADMVLASGDHILFAGRAGVESLQGRFLLDPSPVSYVRTGIEPPRTWLFRWAARHAEQRRHRRRTAAAPRHE